MAKHIMLREEDEQLLLHLHDFIYLDKAFIEKHIYKSYTNKLSIYRRLSALKNAGYIKLFLRQVDNSEQRPSNVYTLTKYGVDTVEQMRGVVHWREYWTQDTMIWWRHQLMIAHAVKSFEKHAPDYGLKVFEWIPEVRAFYEYPINSASKSKTQLRPDGILVIGREDSTERMAIFVEMERSYSTRDRTIKKVDQYNSFFSRQDELMEAYQRKVAFNEEITQWSILFIGGTEAKTNKLLRDLHKEKTLKPILVVSKDDVETNPFGAVYRDNQNPDEVTTL